jgi:ribosomal protein S15P/S13E
MMYKAIDADLTEQRMLDREERRAKLKEQADENKAEREAKERMDIAEKASAKADQKAITRDAGVIGRVASQVQGDSPQMSQADLEQLMKDNPEYRDIYRKAGYIKDTVDPRLQRANDEEQAVRELGAKPQVVESYSKAKKDLLAQISQESKDRDSTRRLDQNDAKLDKLVEHWERADKARDKSADAAWIRANRPADSDKSPRERATTQLNSLNSSISEMRKALEAGEYKPGSQEEKDARTTLAETISQRSGLIKSMNANKAPDADTPPAPKPVQSLPEGAVQIGTSRGKPVYQTKDGRKFIAD